MKTKYSVSILAATFLLTGCADVFRPVTDVGLGIGGGFLANTLSHGDPAMTAIGAVGGVAAGEAINALNSNAKKSAFSNGYEQGRADGVKSTYWNQVEEQKNPPADK